MFIQTRSLKLQVPSFNYANPGEWDRYQSRMKNGLFTLSRETDLLKIDREVENWLNIARNGTCSQCMSMLSVVAYFYPNKMHDSYFKSRIEYFYNNLIKIITNKADEENKNSYSLQDNKKRTTQTTKSNKSNSLISTDKTVAKAPKAKSTAPLNEVKEFDTEFPAFSEGGFPDSDSDVFDKLLKEETKACGEADSEK